MLQIIMFLLAIVCVVVLITTRRKKRPRAGLLRVASVIMALSFSGTGIALAPTPLTADDGVQRANFVGTDMSATEELEVFPLEPFPNGKYILVEDTEDGQFIWFRLVEDGMKHRIPSEEAIFTSNEAFGYEAPVLRYGRGYLSPENRLLTLMSQRWDFIHFVVDPCHFGIWAG